jgi:mycofactocin precursor peptide peptidase
VSPDPVPRLGELTWPELHLARRRPLLAVPLGSCEQHGPHLPLDTDTRIATALAEALVASFDPGDVVVAPPITISASGEHHGFAGTLSIGTDVLTQLVIELVRSADWSSGVVLVNGHGGNAAALQRAQATLAREGRKVLAWSPRPHGGDAHAGHTETSLILALAPHLVLRDRAEAGRTEPLADLLEQLRTEGVRAVSANGVLGDPNGANATHGKNLLTRWTIELVAAVDAWWE